MSSKCFQVESPSPFRFLAALMPPCAHTECDRFTGTMENRSTLPPISAILMTAASPASPPPTTIIFGVAILLHRLSVSCGGGWSVIVRVIVPVGGSWNPLAEGVQAHQAYDAQQHEKCETHFQKPLLRLVAGDNAPLRRRTARSRKRSATMRAISPTT